MSNRELPCSRQDNGGYLNFQMVKQRCAAAIFSRKHLFLACCGMLRASPNSTGHKISRLDVHLVGEFIALRNKSWISAGLSDHATGAASLWATFGAGIVSEKFCQLIGHGPG